MCDPLPLRYVTGKTITPRGMDALAISRYCARAFGDERVRDQMAGSTANKVFMAILAAMLVDREPEPQPELGVVLEQ